MNLPPATIGAAVAEIETPALVIDLDAFDRNVAKMAEFARAAGVRVRPHAKTHKCAAIARPARSASACRRWAKPRRWCAAASPTCW
jgi:D-serine deaminase-like pyridoxal phosphate-dependent protein